MKKPAAKKTSSSKSKARKVVKKTPSTAKSSKSAKKTSGKNQNKTKQSATSPTAFIKSIENDTRRKDAGFLLKWFREQTGMPAKMWGSSIVGYGRYRYQYESGREGDSMITGFSPRKTSLVIYIMPGYQDLSTKLKRLGKHKIGKSCLYINKLEDIDLDVLEEIVQHGIAYMKQNYQTSDK